MDKNFIFTGGSIGAVILCVKMILAAKCGFVVRRWRAAGK
jgi:hypothetical protein